MWTARYFYLNFIITIDTIGDLLCCDGPCKQAFHLKCVDLEKQPEELSWFCSDCLKIKDKVKLF